DYGTITIDVGVTANQILQVNVNNQVPVVDGYLITNTNAQNIQGRYVSNVGPVDAQVLVFNSTTLTWVPSTVSGDATITNTGALRVNNLQGKAVAIGTPTANQTLAWNALSSQWEPMSALTVGTVRHIDTGAGLIGGPITDYGTITIDVGVTANQILQVN